MILLNIIHIYQHYKDPCTMKKIFILFSITLTSTVHCSEKQSELNSEEAIRQLAAAISSLSVLINRPAAKNNKSLIKIIEKFGEVADTVSLINPKSPDEARDSLIQAYNERPNTLIAGILTDKRLQPPTPEQSQIIKKAQALLLEQQKGHK